MGICVCHGYAFVKIVSYTCTILKCCSLMYFWIFIHFFFIMGVSFFFINTLFQEQSLSNLLISLCTLSLLKFEQVLSKCRIFHITQKQYGKFLLRLIHFQCITPASKQRDLHWLEWIYFSTAGGLGSKGKCNWI